MMARVSFAPGVLLAAIALASLLSTIPSEAALDLRGVSWKATELDSLRAAADSLRIVRDYERARAVGAELLRAVPGDGFGLRHFALIARETGTLRRAAEAMEGGGIPAGLEKIELGAADRAFLHGLIELYRGRARSGAEKLREASAARPGWGWPLFYLGRAEQELLMPRRQWETHLQQALADQAAAPAVIAYIADAREPHVLAPASASARAIAAALPAIPWLWGTCEYNALLDTILAGPAPTPREAARRWLSMRERCPMALLDFGGAVVSELTDDLAPAGYEEFLSRVAPSGVEKAIIDLARADRYMNEDNEPAAIALLDASRDSTAASLEIRQLIALNHGAPSELRRRCDSAVGEEIGHGTAGNARWAAEALRDAELDTLVAEARREYPLIDVALRLDRFVEADPVAGSAVLDSLDRAGVEHGYFLHYRMRFSERLGDTLQTARALERLPRLRRQAYYLNAANGAAASGNRGRGARLLREGAALYPESPQRLSNCLTIAVEIGDRKLISELIDDLLRSCPACPQARDRAARALILSNRHDEAARIVRETKGLTPIPPTIGTNLAVLAQELGMPGLADTLLAAAEKELPSSPWVRKTRAYILARGGEQGKARAIYEKLVAEFPGNEDYRSSLLSAGGSVQEAGGAEDAETATAFRGFQHDLSSIDWILAGAAKADTMSGAAAVYLMKRVSCVAHGVDRAVIRHRTTILIRTEQALEIYQPFNISFDASDPVPTVRLARVIHRDGSIGEVPLADILITADPDEAIDVDDSRSVAVPFAGLKVGSVLDLVYDVEVTSWYSNGWSDRHILADVFPVIESVVELSAPTGFEIKRHASGGAPSPIEVTREGRVIRSWRMTDLKAIAFESFAPNLFDTTPWIGFSTHSTAESALEPYRADFWGQVDASPGNRDLVAKLTAGRTSAREKVDAIYRHVTESVRYVAIELDRGRIVPSTPAEVASRGYGDCKDMVAFLISLLEAAGIKAEPVLTMTRDDYRPIEGFPEPFIYSHVIAHVPSVDDLYLDPTTQSPCPAPPPISLGGVQGMAVPRTGAIHPVRLPEAASRQQGFTLEADLWPGPDDRARIEVTCRYRGFLAEGAREALAQPDSSDRAEYISSNLGYGLWDSCRLLSWKSLKDGCDEVVLQAAFEDTAWAGSLNTVTFAWHTEVADPAIFYPNPKKRRHDFLVPFPFADEVVLRLHDSSLWRVEPIITTGIKGAGYEGSLRVEARTSGEDSWQEIRQRFELATTRIDLAGYEKFWNDWVRFLGGIYQNYRYRRVLDEEELRRIDEYVKANPEDAGFALQAATQILGNDAGGEGDSGRERRAAARKLMQPLVGKPTGCWPAVLLGVIESKEGRYRSADSLTAVALRLEPNNVLVQAFALGVKVELRRLDEAIGLYRSILQSAPSAQMELAFISTLYEAGKREDAASAINRYILLHGKADSLSIREAQLQGALRARRGEDCDSIFALMRGQLEPERLSRYESDVHLKAFRYKEAATVLEGIWEDNPFDEAICNNLAWCYALLGRDLDRAEELTELAIMLATDKTASRNTLGAIYARRGEWERARKIFTELRDSDDRPDHLASNDFFVGLCEYELGKKEDALGRWRRILEVEGAVEARIWAESALDLHSRSKPVSGAVFVLEK